MKITQIFKDCILYIYYLKITLTYNSLYFIVSTTLTTKGVIMEELYKELQKWGFSQYECKAI